MVLAAGALVPLTAIGETEPPGAADEVTAPRVDVVGTAENLERIPGSAEVLSPQELEIARVFTTTEALRKAAGVNVRDEEGLGLRPNIGIRGLNPTRSTKVLLLEDGVPLAYAPYGDNASYYHPPVERFDRIEILKGAGQLMFGPQTAGGVINYITPLPTQEQSGFVSLSGGNREYLGAHARYSRSNILLDYVHKQADGSRDNTNSKIDDLNFKAVLSMGSGQALTLRANYYGEDSQLTYSGITQAEADNFGLEYNPFKNDSFAANRVGASATHEIQLGTNAVLTTNVYGALFHRDWWRQSSNTNDTQCNASYPLVGGLNFQQQRAAGIEVDPDLCNSIQGRLRDYSTWGVEPRLRLNHAAFGIDNELDLGVRAHYETQKRKQENGTSPFARSGTVVENNKRTADAYAAFIQNRFMFGAWTVTPALRVENIHYQRDNRLTGDSGKTTLTEWLPGLGATWNPGPDTTVFAGIHRGFSPPRVEDLIDNTGTVVDVPAESSTNIELGVRGVARPGLAYQGAVFHNQFDPQVVVGSVAGGNTPLATGETLYVGAELSGRADFAPLLGMRQDVYLRGSFMWLPTAEIESQFIKVSDGLPVAATDVTGNRLPYAPEYLANVALGYNHSSGFNGEIELVYVGEQFGDFANTVAPSADGQLGLIDSYTLVNLALNYTVKQWGLTAFFAVKNIMDEDYIADRTRGILPGTPRLYQAGLKYEF
jgi:Fe(3+) dicitrate transport protein